MTAVADRTITWLGLALGGSVLFGWLAYENPRLLLGIGLVAAAIFAFLRWPFPLLLVVLALAGTDNQTMELGTLIGGGTALAVAGRKILRMPVVAAFVTLLILAAWRLPLHPVYSDGARPSELLLPIIKVPFLGMPSNAMIAWWRLGFLLVAFGLAAWLIRDRKRLQYAVGAMLAGAVYPIVEGLRQFAAGDLVTRSGSTTRSIEGPFSFPNYFGFYLVGVLIVAVVVLIEARSARIRGAMVVLLAAGLPCFFLTYTRAAWIGFAAAIALLGLLRYRWLIPLGVVAVVTAILAFPSGVDSVSGRFADLSASSPTHSTSSWVWRTGQWDRMIPRGLDRPLTGVGFGGYEAETVKEFGFQTSQYKTLADEKHPETSAKGFTAHNDYVRMLVELGIPGVLLWTLVLFSMLAMAMRAMRAPGARPFAAAATAIMAAIIGMSFADNVQGYTMDLLIPLVLTGAVTTVARTELSARHTGAAEPSPSPSSAS